MNHEYKEAIQNFVRSLSQEESKDFRIDYSVASFGAPSEINRTYSTMLSILLKVTYKEQEFSTVLDVLRLPVSTENGFLIHGTNYEVVPSYDKCAGVYTDSLEVPANSKLKKIGQNRKTVVRLSPEWKADLYLHSLDAPRKFTYGEKSVKATVGSSQVEQTVKVEAKDLFRLSVLDAVSGRNANKNVGSIPVFVLMCALSGKTYKQIMSDIVLSTVDIDKSSMSEVSYSQCVGAVYSFIKNISGWALAENLPISAATNMVKQWANSIRLSSYPRYERVCSVAYRALGFKLAETYTYHYFDSEGKQNKRVFEKDSTITDAVLEDAEYMLPSQIAIECDGKILRLENRSSTVFKALGCKLCDDLTFINSEQGKDVYLGKGTILDKYTLDQLNKFYKGLELSVESPIGKVVLTRKAARSGLTYDDLLTYINIYAQYSMGFLSEENMYSVGSKKLTTPEQRTLDYLSRNIDNISAAIRSTHLMSSQGGGEVNLPDNVVAALSLVDFNKMRETLMIQMQNGSREKQLPGMTNLLHRSSQTAKIASNIGGSTSDNMAMMQEDQYGFIDPLDAPESEKMSTVHRTCMFAKSEGGILFSPYVLVKNGVMTDEIVNLSAIDLKGKNVAEWCEEFKDDIITVRRDGNIYSVPRELVNYVEYSVFSGMSAVRTMIPFQEFCAPRRNLMGVNHSKQSPPLLLPERPFVSTGGDSIIDGLVLTAEEILRLYLSQNELVEKPEHPISECVIELVGVKTERVNYRTLTFKSAYGRFTHNIYFGHSEKNSIYGMRINDKTRFFKGTDAVCYNVGADTKKYDRIEKLDYGAFVVPPEKLDIGLAYGRNLLIGFKTHASSTIDDSFVISEKLVGSGEFSTIVIKEYRLEESSFDDMETRIGITESSDLIDNLSGLVKVGTHVLPGDPLIGYHISKLNSTGHDEFITAVVAGEVIHAKTEKISKSEHRAVVLVASIYTPKVGDKMAGRHGDKGVIGKTLPEHMMPYNPETGETLDVICSPLGLRGRMNLGQLVEALLGLCMRRQNKICVLSPMHKETLDFLEREIEKNGVGPMKLIDPETGRPFLRPISVGCLYMQKMEQLSFTKAKAIGVPAGSDPLFQQPKGTYNGAGGQKIGEGELWCLTSRGCQDTLRDIFTINSADMEGRQAFLKKMAEDVYDLSVMKECASEVLGESHKEYIGNNDINTNHFLAFFKLLGINVIASRDKKSLILVPLTNAELVKYSELKAADENNLGEYHNSKNRNSWKVYKLPCSIVNPYWLKYGYLPKVIYVNYQMKNGSTVKRDISANGFIGLIHGTKEMYISNGEIYLRDVNKNSNDTTSRYVKGYQAIVQIFEQITFEDCIRWVNAAIANIESSGGSFEKRAGEIYKHKGYLNFIYSMQENGISLNRFLVNRFPVLPPFFRPTGRGRGGGSSDGEGSTFGSMVSESSLTRYYRLIAKSILSVPPSLPYTSVKELYMQIAGLLGITFSTESGVKRNKNSLIELYAQPEGNTSDKKHGYIRDKMLSKQQGFSFRAVIVPAVDTKRTILEMGVPWYAALRIYGRLYSSHIVQTLDDVLMKANANFIEMYELEGLAPDYSLFDTCKGYAYNFIKTAVVSELENFVSNLYEFNFRVFRTYMPLAPVKYCCALYTALREHIAAFTNIELNTERLKMVNYDCLPEQICMVLSGRQPSLHPYSTLSFYVYLVDGFAIHLHPLVCKGYNADFDGDTMYGLAILSEEARAEAREKLMAWVNPINQKDDNLILECTQDIVLGVYCMTMLQGNRSRPNFGRETEEYRDNLFFYSDLEEMVQDVTSCELRPYDFICLEHAGRKYLSTAGRIMFNSCFTDGFTDRPHSNVLELPFNLEGFCDLKYDGLVSKTGKTSSGVAYTKGLQSIMRDEYTPEGVLYYSQKIMELGFWGADKYGVSTSLEDLKSPIDNDKFLNNLEDKLQVLKEELDSGLLSPEAYEEFVGEVSSDIKSKMKVELQKTMEDNHRDSDTFITVDSGARGNWDQVLQTVGMVGLPKKTNKEMINYPILKSYGSGLTSFQMMQASYSARMDVYAMQKEVRSAGYLTRQSIYMTGGYKVVEHDCGSHEDEQHSLEMRYSEDFVLKKVSADGSLTKCKEDLTEKHILATDPNFNKLRKLLWSDETGEKENRISGLALKCITSLHIRELHTVEGVYVLEYKLSPLSRDMVLGSFASGVPVSEDEGLATEETISYIEEHCLERVNIRTVLGCKSEGGVCAKCYGKHSGSNKLLPIGTVIGLPAAQAICEQASQMSLNLVHTGTGGNSAISAFSRLLSGKSPGKGKNGLEARVSDISGVASIKYFGARAIITIRSLEDPTIMRTYKEEAGKVIIKDGFFVNKGTPITMGWAPVSVLSSIEDAYKLQSYQLDWLAQYLIVFSDLKICIKNFEILVRLQSSLVRVLESDDEELEPGFSYDLQRVRRSIAQGHNISVMYGISEQDEVIEAVSGGLSLACFEDIFSKIGVLSGKEMKSKSVMSDVFVGKTIGSDTFDIKLPNKMESLDKIFSDIVPSLPTGGVTFSPSKKKANHEITPEGSFDLLDFTEKDLSLDYDLDYREPDYEVLYEEQEGMDVDDVAAEEINAVVVEETLTVPAERLQSIGKRTKKDAEFEAEDSSDFIPKLGEEAHTEEDINENIVRPEPSEPVAGFTHKVELVDEKIVKDEIKQILSEYYDDDDFDYEEEPVKKPVKKKSSPKTSKKLDTISKKK